MREDMFEVIVERPRWGSRRLSYTRHDRRAGGKITLRQDPDGLRLQIGLRRASKEARVYKSLNENLNPLRRYLEQRVNRPWNKVWADICANLKPTSTVQQHVRDHVTDFVAIHTYSKDSTIWVSWRDGQPERLCDSIYWLYVDPRTGLLRRNKHRKTWRQVRRAREVTEAKERATRMRELGPDLQAHRFRDGAWWEVRLAPVPWEPAPAGHRGVSSWKIRSLPYTDVVLASGLTDLPAEKLYACRGVYAVAKRQLSRKEVTALGLPR